jgi:hypothetical protein
MEPRTSWRHRYMRDRFGTTSFCDAAGHDLMLSDVLKPAVLAVPAGMARRMRRI